jgi:ABC-type Zn uptake system ZnuABC Zn-binding protein ZnuA
MKLLGQAKVVFFNGAGLEEWWSKAVKAIASKETPVVELSRGLATLKPPTGAHGGHGHAEEQDPHVWLDPMLTKVYVDRIRDTLTRVYPDNGGVYADRAQVYQGKLEALDAWIRSETEKIPPARRKLVTFHDAFQYFARRYGYAVKGYIVVSPGKEPSAKVMAELVRRVKQDQIPAVFAEAGFNPKLLETLGREAGVKVVTDLYHDSLSEGPPADSYLALMRHNVTMIVSGLR